MDDGQMFAQREPVSQPHLMKSNENQSVYTHPVSEIVVTPAAIQSDEVRTVRVRIFLPGVTEGRGRSVCGDCFTELFEGLKLPFDSNVRFSLLPPSEEQPNPPVITERQLWALAKNTALYMHRN